MKVGTSSYYEYLQRSDTKVLDQEIERAVITVFRKNKRRYGTRRIVSTLKDEGLHVGRARVSTVLKRNNLKAIQPKSFVPKTTTASGHRRSPNLLLDRGFPNGPNEVWVGDITYLPLQNGNWSYLSTWMDLWSRYILGWHVADHMEASLVIRAFKKAMIRRPNSEDTIIHSDGGGQYGSSDFRKMLDGKFVQSMTRKANHYDNAHAESLFSRFKSELLEGGKFLSVEDARTECFEYIEAYYNTQRKHSSLGYKTPLQFESEMGF